MILSKMKSAILIPCGICDIPCGAIYYCVMRYVSAAREKEFMSYRNGAKRSYIAFKQSENISHERERVYR